MRTPEPSARAAGWRKSCFFLALAILCFQLAYASVKVPLAGLLMFGYAYFLIQLTNQPTVRRAFYFGLAAGFADAAGQAFFFAKIFSAAAVVLWLVFAFWIGIFTAVSCGCIRRWGMDKAICLVPVIWTGTEYFRSELYYLRFSWLNIGYAFTGFPCAPFHFWGMYGVGFIVFAIAAALVCVTNGVRKFWITRLVWGLILIVGLSWLSQVLAMEGGSPAPQRLKLAGVQMEFPPEKVIPKILTQALAKYTNAQIFVLSEYTLDGGVPASLKEWCRLRRRYLVVGGKDVVTNDVYYDTAFVVGTNGEIIFKQAKSVPIQFFKDGLPARRQALWDSPWGEIGICICYDLSYTRVTDELVRQGAQLLIVPTMDVEEWGRHEHELHSRVAPVRAAEYGVPIFRVASSGISQAVTADGSTIARASMPGNGDIFAAEFEIPARGSLPLDRFLAPFCVIATGAILAILLFLTGQEKKMARK